MAATTPVLPESTNPNTSIEITPELREDMMYSIQRLVRLAQKSDSAIEEKRLSWEVIRTIRAEMRETRSVNGNDLVKAVAGLLPQVNVQVNVDRQHLETKAEHGLTRQVRERAAAQLAKLDAARAGQQLPASTARAETAPASTTDDLIEAAAKVEGQRK